MRASRDAIRLAVDNAKEFVGDDDGRGGGRDRRLARKLLNDTGNSERLIARHGSKLLYVEEIGWLWWTGTHWSAALGELRAHQAAVDTAKKIFGEADAIEEEEPKRAQKLRGEWAIESGNSGRLVAMMRLGGRLAQKEAAALDVDLWLFNTQNGTLELPCDPALPVRLRRHAKRDLITKVAAVGYDPDATCPAFRAFLDRVLPDREVQHFLQCFFGYCLSGAAREHVLVFFLGEGRNGKGTLIRLMSWLWGDYAGTIDFASLAAHNQRSGSEPSPDIARLAGARLLLTSEPNKGVRLDDGRIKSFTGEDRQIARHLNRGFFEFDPQFKLVVQGNNKPRITDTSGGMWERLKLVLFNVVIPAAERDPELTNKLKAEGPGMLNWALDGFRLWREQGLQPPSAVREATQRFRDESDVFGTFLAAATTPNPAGSVVGRQLFNCYVGWMKAQDWRPITDTKFGAELTARGFKTERRGSGSARAVWRLGLTWRPENEIGWEWAP